MCVDFKEFQKRKEKNMLEYYVRFQDTRDESIEHDEKNFLGRNDQTVVRFTMIHHT